MVKFKNDMDDVNPQHIDYQELVRSTKVHIRGLKLQLIVAQATLVIATIKEKETRKEEPEKPEEPRDKTEEATHCESTKTDTKD